MGDCRLGGGVTTSAVKGGGGKSQAAGKRTTGLQVLGNRLKVNKLIKSS